MVFMGFFDVPERHLDSPPEVDSRPRLCRGDADPVRVLSAYFVFSLPWSRVIAAIGYQWTMVLGLVRTERRRSPWSTMAIVGGAILPLLQGLIADRVGIHRAFWVPVLCYSYIVYYAVRGSKPNSQRVLAA
jgi:fucose permease